MYKELAGRLHQSDRPVTKRAIARDAKRLMREIDGQYESGKESGLEDLEILLEATLDSLEAALMEADEDHDSFEDLEPDVDGEPDAFEGCSIEEQLVEAYGRHLASPSFFTVEGLADCVADVLMSAQMGGMTPSGYRGASGEVLVELAREVQREYRTEIGRRLTRIGGRPWGPSSHGSNS